MKYFFGFSCLVLPLLFSMLASGKQDGFLRHKEFLRLSQKNKFQYIKILANIDIQMRTEKEKSRIKIRKKEKGKKVSLVRWIFRVAYAEQSPEVTAKVCDPGTHGIENVFFCGWVYGMMNNGKGVCIPRLRQSPEERMKACSIKAAGSSTQRENILENIINNPSVLDEEVGEIENYCQENSKTLVCRNAKNFLTSLPGNSSLITTPRSLDRNVSQ